MSEATAVPSQTRAPFVPSFGGYLGLLRGRLHTAVRVAAVLVTSLLSVASLGVYLVKHKSDLFDTIAGRTFCCPEDAREASKFVNALEAAGPPDRAREHRHHGPSAEGVRAAEATRFLIGYYKSCIETIPNKADFIWELAHQLARAMRELLAKPDPRNALIFAATTLLKYRLPSAIEIDLEPALIEVSAVTICKLESLPPRVLMYSIRAVTNVTGHQVKPDAVAQLAERVCHRFVSGNKKMAWRGTADVLKATLWNVVALRSTLADIGYDADEKTTSVRVKGVAGVLATHDSFVESGHDGARATYLLLHSVSSATHQMYEKQHLVMTDEVVRRICKASVQEIAEIWDMFTAEILATLDKENQLRTIFAAVKDAVYHDCAASAAFDDEDSARIGDFVQRLTLDVTMDAKRSAVAVPDVSRKLFAENLLRGRAYDFYIRREGRRGVKSGKFSPARYIWIPPVMYDMVRTGSETSSEIANMAGLGWLIARAIWEVVLSTDFRSPKMAAAFEHLRSCFNTDGRGKAKNVSVPLILGLSTVLNAFSRPKWETMRPAWGPLEMSHGQMFYTLAVYYNCPFDSTPEEVVQFNEALMYSGDFASVFRCPADSPMAKKPRCSL
ncbi:hypothetical protein HPB52_014394 [Rhipicephalus sanguineus]|uniref:Uncharacterized protein n=1 Tax=Rhipicephalus sanguineus TaxID=34632 RepID=A0A9D4QGR4_RHISA|nr:hypothetical protein HPB52_014394 [Rhipicephalus sanguineus]